ncbi:hypothetical protein Bca4012_026557 [Brassica carinata]
MTILSLNLSVSAPPLGPPPAPKIMVISNGPLAPSSVNQPVTTLKKPTAFPSLGAHGPFPPGTAVAAANAANWPSLPKENAFKIAKSCIGQRLMELDVYIFLILMSTLMMLIGVLKTEVDTGEIIGL